MHISAERFEKLAFDIADAVLEQLPPDLRSDAETVILDIADRPAPTQLRLAESPGGTLLGLYEGIPLIHRHADTQMSQHVKGRWNSIAMPSPITTLSSIPTQPGTRQFAASRIQIQSVTAEAEVAAAFVGQQVQAVEAVGAALQAMFDRLSLVMAACLWVEAAVV
ncbi:MAG: hypothetical protein FJ030_14110 [Chloroflexi bacterium]|nr:hypothetical protein [Chloroflexota bacterium]